MSATPQISDEDCIFSTLAKTAETQEFAALIRQLPDVVSKLNDRSRCWTVWAPADSVLQKSMQVPLEELRHLIYRLLSPHDFPTAALSGFPNVVLVERPPNLNGEQLLRTRPVFHSQYGPTYSVNFSTYISKAGIAAVNGTIHVIDAIPQPLPTMVELLETLPLAAFSILRQAINVSSIRNELFREDMQGGTFFAPTNKAFASVGVHSPEDVKRAEVVYSVSSILRRHFCPEQTLYSNRLYMDRRELAANKDPIESLGPSLTKFKTIKGDRTFTLRSALPGREVKIHVHRDRGFIDMRMGKDIKVTSADHLANDGVVHVVDGLLLDTED